MDIQIYDKLAKNYDFATKVISFGIEDLWRAIFVKEIKKHIKNGVLLDVGSATGEMAIKMDFDKMYLIEPSAEMIKIIIRKFQKKGYVKEDFEVVFIQSPHVRLRKGKKEVIIIQDVAEKVILPEKVDLITAFMALRNFDNLDVGVINLDKFLKKEGFFGIVEMVKENSFFAKMVLWYMEKIVPIIAGILFNMKSEYKLLGKSVSNLEEEKILNLFPNYEIIKSRKLLLPITKMIIMRKDGKGIRS